MIEPVPRVLHPGTYPHGAESCGDANYVHATVELADWDDVDDLSEPVCSATLED